MAILTVQNAAKFYGIDQVFSGVSFLLEPGEKLALVGRNGAGKTTLLKLLLGRLEADEGRVSLGSGYRMGYLSQDPELGDGPTLVAEATTALAFFHAAEARMRDLEQRISATSDEAALAELMDEYGRVTARFEVMGGYDAPARVKMVLFGLGFKAEDLDLPVSGLSGGQKVRLGLAKLLLEAPDLLLLDEPTNHLDLESTEWLEGFLRQYRGAAILVSHDRYFLDRVVGKTLELEDGTGSVYQGNYSHYLQVKAERLKQQEALWRRQQEEADKLKAYIRKYGAGNRSTQAHDRERKLERMQLIERPQLNTKQMGLKFTQDYETGDEVLKLDGVGKSFDRKVLFEDLHREVRRGERVALVGPNGAGKTTFLKLLAGVLKPSAGYIWWGVGVDKAYFSQDLDQISPANTALQEMQEIPGMTNYEARSLLGRFLFSGETVEKRIADLSGGERNRLTLAKLMISGANVLLLDEPTNHLDIGSRTMLEDALAVFPGTVFIVSHDRYFLDRVATRVWEFGGGQVRDVRGNYSDYRALKEAEADALANPAPQQPTAAVAEGPRGQKGERAAAKKSQAEVKRLQAEVRRLENAIARAEDRKAELEQLMSDPEFYRQSSCAATLAEYKNLETDLGRLLAEWEAAEAAHARAQET